ncbi:unnamed protein product, partial [Scytosiphon promiscuus]
DVVGVAVFSCPLEVRSQVKQCSLCNDVWYCGNECQAKDWTAGHKSECSRKK